MIADDNGFQPIQLQDSATTVEKDVNAGAHPSSFDVDRWGRVSRVFCIVGGVLAILAGLSLVSITSHSENNILRAIASGLGIYCVDKGVFMIAIAAQFREAVSLLYCNI